MGVGAVMGVGAHARKILHSDCDIYSFVRTFRNTSFPWGPLSTQHLTSTGPGECAFGDGAASTG
jgi:hypothetical protein